MKTIKNIIYKLIDLFTFGKGIKRNINGVPIRFPAAWSRYFENDYESENVKFIKIQCKPGMVVIDIGAHLGVIAMSISHSLNNAGKIYAFEPTPNTFSLLCRIVKLNKCSTIIPINKAVSDRNETLSFYIDNNLGSNANSLVSKNERNRQSIDVETITIDQFVTENKINKIDFLKIDAEGSELSVLKGAIKTLKNHKPLAILAIHPRLISNNGDNIKDIYLLLKSLNYNIYLKEKEIDQDQFIMTKDFFDVHLIPMKIRQ